MTTYQEKITNEHRTRDCYLYIRQSSLKQIQCNQESTKRQYALRDKALALGWSTEQIHVIDQDQGRSGAQANCREGFQYLVSQVSLKQAGLIMGLEVSRLARNSSDWHRLLELCALTDTLILDEDGLYDSKSFNDRLVLGLKGTMSEAELHMIKARLQGGMMNKAKRGELKIPIPIGYVYDDRQKVVLDPNQRIQDSIRQLFDCFDRKRSACGVVKTFNGQGWLFPQRLARGINKGDLIWGKITHARVLNILHNPCYAGAYVYGRRQTTYLPTGESRPRVKPQSDWLVHIKDKRPAYISWEQYERNKQQLTGNVQAHDNTEAEGPPREGNALLQGIVICGHCGQRMTVRYHQYHKKIVPDYMCQRAGIQQGKQICQSIQGKCIDRAISDIVIELMSPVTLELSIAVQKELEQRWNESDTLWEQRLEQSRFLVNVAKRRFLQVDPDNRLVASTLESDWNKELAELEKTQVEYKQYQKRKVSCISQEQEKKILSLSQDFSTLWDDPNIAAQERKRMIRFLVEDVTLKKMTDNIELHIRFKGGQSRSIELEKPRNATEVRHTEQDVITRIKALSKTHPDGVIACLLNEEGLTPYQKSHFTAASVYQLRHHRKIPCYRQHLLDQGWLTATELAKKIHVATPTIHRWRRAGLIKGDLCSDKKEYLFKITPDTQWPKKKQGSPLSKRDK